MISDSLLQNFLFNQTVFLRSFFNLYSSLILLAARTLSSSTKTKPYFLSDASVRELITKNCEFCSYNTEMGIRFILVVDRKGQTRLTQYYECLTLKERRALEGELVRKCLARNEQQCSFVEHRNYKIVYRRYASLFFMVGVDNEENELAILEFIHLIVETMNHYFNPVNTSSIMYDLEKVHFMLEEMVMSGCIVETSMTNILNPIQPMDETFHAGGDGHEWLNYPWLFL